MSSTGVRSCVQLGWGIINGFTYLHEHKVADLEIKPNNLVCDDHFRLQIIDFNVRAKTQRLSNPRIGQSDIGISSYQGLDSARIGRARRTDTGV